MLRRAFVLLAGTMALAACQPAGTGAPVAMNQAPGARSPGQAGQVAILLPLSGRLGDVGKPMLRAAQLSLAQPGSPVLEAKDTGGTPEGAARAAREAIAAGARMILGPLTSAETAQVAPVARQAGVPVLAFTNDQSQSQPGVWTLGITPGQQIDRLLAAVKEAGREPVAALLPNNDFGRAMAEALNRAAAGAGLPPPFVRMHDSGKDAIAAAVNDLAATVTEGQPPPFGSVLLGATGNDLKLFAKAFADSKIDRTKVRILGPALWVEPASGSPALVGAWFAMPDPDTRREMSATYEARYKEAPPARADLAHDAASIARVLAGQGRMTTAGLTQPVGFNGVDGWLALSPDGQVRRGLAVFRVERSRPVRIGAAPVGGSKPGS